MVKINLNEVSLEGDLILPPKAKSLVVFAHGSGSSRFSPRNKFVAKYLQKNGLGTLLLDLLTKEEEIEDEETLKYRFDIQLLSQRLIEIVKWLKRRSQTKDLKIGFFGASTGASGALVAAADLGEEIGAVVSRGGRPDLANEALFKVQAAVLLIVGGEDQPVLDLNQSSLGKMVNVKNKQMVIIPGATHLFEEPGALEEVSKYALEWFQMYLAGSKPGI